MYTEYNAAYYTYNEFGEHVWEISIRFELSRLTIEQLEADNETHNFSRCYPVDADSCRVY